jgi:hypothetical protein
MSFTRTHNQNGTSNQSYLLNANDENFIKSLVPAALESAFGHGGEGCYEPTRGYEDPEWYWVDGDGHTWGIGWRWGSTRLRAKGAGEGFLTPHPSKEAAAAFVNFLRGEMSEHNQRYEALLANG